MDFIHPRNGTGIFATFPIPQAAREVSHYRMSSLPISYPLHLNEVSQSVSPTERERQEPPSRQGVRLYEILLKCHRYASKGFYTSYQVTCYQVTNVLTSQRPKDAADALLKRSSLHWSKIPRLHLEAD